MAARLLPFTRQGGLDVWGDASSQMGNKSNAQSIKQIPVEPIKILGVEMRVFDSIYKKRVELPIALAPVLLRYSGARL